jgi:hypothetical protein
MSKLLVQLGDSAHAFVPVLIITVVVAAVFAMVAQIADLLVAGPRVGQPCITVVYQAYTTNEVYGSYELYNGRVACAHHREDIDGKSALRSPGAPLRHRAVVHP